MTDIIFSDVRDAIPAVWGNESTFSSYKPSLDNAKLKLVAYVGNDVVDSDDATIKALVKGILIKDAFATAAPTLMMYHDGKSFVMGEGAAEKRATPEDVAFFTRGLRAQFFTEMNALLLALESNTTLHDKWKITPSYSLIDGGIIPNLTILMSLTKLPAINSKYPSATPTRMDFVREWRPDLVAYGFELQKYFGKDVIADMLKDDYEELQHALRMVLIEFVFGDKKHAYHLRNDLMREMADNTTTYEFITKTDVYTRYVAAKSNRRSNSSSSRIYVGG